MPRTVRYIPPLFISHSHLQCHQGTPVFIARAAQLGRGVPVRPKARGFEIPEVPSSSVERYRTCHPDRIKKFPHRPHEYSLISTEGTDHQWRHELDHDTESVFWVFFYWLVGAQPENETEEPIAADIWAALTGSVNARINLLRRDLLDATHSVYQPLCPLVQDLACILDIDRHWVKSSDPRNDPGYINEAFQRLILQFIVEHRTDKCMQHRVESQPRRPEPMLGFPCPSSDTGTRKRSLSEPTILSEIRGGTKRLRMAEQMIEVGRPPARCVCFNSVFSGFSGQRRRRESVCRRSRRKVGWGG